MRLYLDDVRVAPRGWVQAREYSTAVQILLTGEVTEISFDHDLGPGKSGYDVACWLEKAVCSEVIPLPEKMHCHSDNPPGRRKIMQCIGFMQRKAWLTAQYSCVPNKLTKKVLLETKQEDLNSVESVDKLFEELDDDPQSMGTS